MELGLLYNDIPINCDVLLGLTFDVAINLCTRHSLLNRNAINTSTHYLC